MATESDALAPGQDAVDDARPDAGPAPAVGTWKPDDDPDANELAAARAAVEAEAEGAPPPDQNAPPAPAAAPAQAIPPAEPQQPEPAPIPFARFREVNRRAQQLAEENAYLKGAVAVLGNQAKAPAGQAAPDAPPGQAAPQAAPQGQPQARITAARQQIEALADRFDAGELTLKEYEAQRGAIEDGIIAPAQVEMRAPAAPVAQTSLADQQIMQQQLDALYGKHAYARGLDNAQVSFLADVVRAEAQAMGRPIGNGPADTLRLREQVAILSDTYGPRWGQKPAALPAPSQQQQSAPPGARPLSPTAQARLAKHEFAAGLPPDTAALGSSGGTDALSEASLLAMSDEEIAALPATTRSRLFAR